MVYGEYGLRIHTHPGHLVPLEVLHDAGEQSVAANGDGDIGNGFGEAWHVAICVRAGKGCEFASKQLISKEKRGGGEGKVHLLKSSLVPHLTLWSPFDAIHKGERRKARGESKWQMEKKNAAYFRAHSFCPLARTCLLQCGTLRIRSVCPRRESAVTRGVERGAWKLNKKSPY